MLEKLLQKKSLLISIFTILVIGGIGSFSGLSKLEDPEIPVKAAVVITPYQGATAEEVDLEVTEPLVKAIQKLENIDKIESKSVPGLSQIIITLQGHVNTSELPQAWDHLRRKVHDAKGQLPQNAGEPIINDDFGDVYGIFMAVVNDGYSYDEHKHYTELIQEELLEVEGVKRIELVGLHSEAVNISFSSEKFANLGINPMSVIQALNDESQVTNAGSVISGEERINLNIGSKFNSVQDIKEMNIYAGNNKSFRLGDIATVSEDFMVPKRGGISYNGQTSMGLGVSMESGGNIIKLGERVDKRLEEILAELPAGIGVEKIYNQPGKVDEAIDGFVINLIESVAIVVIVLLIFMGLRAGLLIASSLVFTILTSFIVMGAINMTVDRVSLAAIIIAMGMLVDNAVVVVDGILVDLQKGLERHKAFVLAAKQNAFPLIGATIIAILAFMPLAFNNTEAGEFLKPLFFVLAIALSISWVLAMVQAPFMASVFYSGKKNKDKNEDSKNKDPYAGKFYTSFRKLVKYALWHKAAVSIFTVVILILSFWAFKFVNSNFFPMPKNNQMIVEYKLPEGSNIEETEADILEIQQSLMEWDRITKVVTSTGMSPIRYTLMRPMISYSPAYGELILQTKENKDVPELIPEIEEYFSKKYPNAVIRCRQYMAIGGDYRIQAKFSGPDLDVLRDLAAKAEDIMDNEPDAAFVNVNWGNQIKTLVPVYSPEKARPLNITRGNMATALSIASEGKPVATMHDKSTTLPIMLKLEPGLSESPSNIGSVPVWGNYSKTSVPMALITDSVSLRGNNYLITRYNASRAIKAQCDPVRGKTTPVVLEKIRPEIEAIPLPNGYSLEWEGELKDQEKANKALFENLPLALLLMVLITIALFNNFKQPIIIFLIVPLAFIGVIFGFLVTRMSFGFVPIIGALGLIGMMIKNSVVLLDQINIDIKAGKSKAEAIVSATLSRVRPVSIASLTTILGMFPLLFDAMFNGMAVAIMFGLLFGTIITLVIVPVLYALFYKVDTRSYSHH